MAAPDDDDDVIIEEIPVFLSKNLQDNLHLFQYPTKANHTNFDNAAVVNCCVKPMNQEVKVDFALNTESRFYDRFKGEQFALAADGKTQGAPLSKPERPTYKRGIMDKQAFLSSRSIDDVAKYIVGIYADKEVHLSPLTSILQLRPSFAHFDKEDKRSRAEQKALNEEDEDEELQQVTVKFARPGTAGAAGATGTVTPKKTKDHQGYSAFLKKSVDEPWCETYWHPRTSPTAELERQKLFATSHQPSNSLALKSVKYMEKLLPNRGQAQGIDAVLPTQVISKSRLKAMTLVDQLKVLLKDAKMMSLDELVTFLCTHIDPKMTEERVIRQLPAVGVMLHGNWVLQSELLYPQDTLSSANGVSAELMTRARDYIIFRFSRTPFLYRRQVVAATQLPPEEATEVLRSVARLNEDKNWELFLPPDKECSQRYPELVQRQEMVWRATEQTYNEMDFEKSPKRIRKRSMRDTKATPSPQHHPTME